MPLASFIIRGRNEAHNLKKLFPALISQTERDYEFIYVDNESKDDSIRVATQYGARIISIPKNEFSYPKALNRGAEEAKGRFLVILSAHSFPMSNGWLSSGLHHFKASDVAGVYGPTCAYEDSPTIEKIDKFPGTFQWILRKIIPPKIVRRVSVGVLGFTNAIVPKSLWETHQFDESYARGGEDGEWARYFIGRGYYLVKDPAFAVRHAHYISTPRMLLAQYRYWNETAHPQEFNRDKFSFRKDYERYK
jgi:glycosyltransferase involved in cell wall biosynthesis